ncbi:flagellar biosynthesis repressor FlbT [uncultured Litoreibacter sp.]|uniref:flagellar biosynthesis repressor FlbT n=1 Tax=uncultured Litoreibacter sp. TaxID=1392394 RepID=UPI002610AD17|nr:flagellar biosynthesis repressor FlbT [uncultured Litoreibacter sp.]
MSGLVLKLGPNERVLINGAVIENGNRRNRINILTPNANILRLRDAIHPQEANTPVRRVCYILQLILSGDTELSDAKHQAMRGVEQLSHVLTDMDSRALLSEATDHIRDSNIYPALKALRCLLPREARLLSEPPA